MEFEDGESQSGTAKANESLVDIQQLEARKDAIKRIISTHTSDNELRAFMTNRAMETKLERRIKLLDREEKLIEQRFIHNERLVKARSKELMGAPRAKSAVVLPRKEISTTNGRQQKRRYSVTFPLDAKTFTLTSLPKQFEDNQTRDKSTPTERIDKVLQQKKINKVKRTKTSVYLHHQHNAMFPTVNAKNGSNDIQDLVKHFVEHQIDFNTTCPVPDKIKTQSEESRFQQSVLMKETKSVRLSKCKSYALRSLNRQKLTDRDLPDTKSKEGHILKDKSLRSKDLRKQGTTDLPNNIGRSILSKIVPNEEKNLEPMRDLSKYQILLDANRPREIYLKDLYIDGSTYSRGSSACDRSRSSSGRMSRTVQWANKCMAKFDDTKE
ncbi:unnamed protein product [Owenia fusiformis]|uniref:Uncharacterized protein n=1 Tax=Owenia fusiformis TaxID=6347 RepID=A0A8J1XL40_OWEFU|nr:unnamed protein product [Owenia fusiformis]